MERINKNMKTTDTICDGTVRLLVLVPRVVVLNILLFYTGYNDQVICISLGCDKYSIHSSFDSQCFIIFLIIQQPYSMDDQRYFFFPESYLHMSYVYIRYDGTL